MVLAFSAGQLEVRVIQDIEAFRSKLELRALRDLEVLKQRGIPGHEPWTGKRVTTKGSGVSRHRTLENTVVTDDWILVVAEVSAPTVSPHVVRSAAEVGDRRVGTVVGFEILIKVATGPRAVTEGLPVRTSVIRSGAIELPPPQDCP